MPLTADKKSTGTSRIFHPLALALIALVPAVLTLSETAANIVVDSNPQTAHTLAPRSGLALAERASAEFIAKPSANEADMAAMLARRALLADPTAVEAVIVLAQQATLQGRTENAGRLMRYADSLSRRELGAHLWSIEAAAADGDIATALGRYDLALRTSRAAPDVLYPPLRRAIREPLVSDALIEVLNGDADWGQSFFEDLGKNPTDAASSATFLAKASRAGLKVQRSAKVDLINALIEERKYDNAWTLFASIPGSAVRGSVQNGDFKQDPEAPSHFDWNLLNEDGIYSALVASANGGLVEFQSARAKRGEIASQMLLLDTGPHRFSAVVDIQTGLDQQLSWSIVCLDAEKITDISANQVKGSLVFTSRFVVPMDCPAQKLTFMVRPRGRVDALAGTLRNVRINKEPRL